MPSKTPDKSTLDISITTPTTTPSKAASSTTPDPNKRTFQENIALLESILNDPKRSPLNRHQPENLNLSPNMTRCLAEGQAIIARMRARRRTMQPRPRPRPRPSSPARDTPPSPPSPKDPKDPKDPHTRAHPPPSLSPHGFPYEPLYQCHFNSSFACRNATCASLIDSLTWGLFIYDASWGIYDPRRRPPFFNTFSPEAMEALPVWDRIVTEIVMPEEAEEGYVRAILEKLGFENGGDDDDDDDGEETGDGDPEGIVEGNEKKKGKGKGKASEVDWTVKSEEEIAFAQYRVDYHAWLHYLIETRVHRWELGDYMDTQRWKWCLERGRGQNWGDLRGRYVWERRGGI
ncbi:hypothetical protein BJY01DRAFT_246381 [Aspergillus pseudoustus]|uniref:Uncharacterized protein n=1 Tax=Aspergillus pseudoustus TaxID=1810923 RepID=A0ABR4K8C4_9EURO